MSENQRQNGSDSDGNGHAAPPAADAATETQALAEKYKNDLLYLRAEFENYKRNAIKERSEMAKYGSEKVLVAILGVLDNFERALETKPTAENLANYVKGVEMTAAEFRSVLQKFGVQEVPSLGQNFDPAVHEAISSEETTQYQPGQVSRVFQKPYRLHDRVIRPGQVVVAKAPSGS